MKHHHLFLQPSSPLSTVIRSKAHPSDHHRNNEAMKHHRLCSLNIHSRSSLALPPTIITTISGGPFSSSSLWIRTKTIFVIYGFVPNVVSAMDVYGFVLRWVFFFFFCRGSSSFVVGLMGLFLRLFLPWVFVGLFLGLWTRKWNWVCKPWVKS